MQINKTLRYAILVGIFLLPFICLYVSDHLFFPFITGKNFAFRIIVEIITGLWIILALRDSSASPRSSRLLQAFAVFLGLIFISDLLSPNSFKSFWSNYERMEGWVTLAHLFALFTVLSSMMSRKLWDWLFRTSIGVSLILFVYGCAQLIGSVEWFNVHAPKMFAYFHANFPIHQGSTRIDTTIGNSAYLGGYMLFHIFLSLYLLFYHVRKHYGTYDWSPVWPIFYGFAVLADTFILFETATRGAGIGLVAGLLVFAAVIAFFEKEHKTIQRTGAGILIAIAVFGGIFVLQRKSDFVTRNESLSRLGSFVDQVLTFDKKIICEGELKSRCLLWPVAFNGVKEKPIFGWGQESFNYVFNKYYDPKMYSQEQWFDRTHNVFLDWLIAGGILGLLAYLSLFGFALYYLWKQGSRFSLMEKSLVTGLLVGYFFHNLTVFDNLTSYILFVMVLAWIDSSGDKTPHFLDKKIATLDKGVRDRIVVPVVAIGFVFIIYFVNVPAILASSTLIQALSGHPAGPTENLAYFQKAFSYNTFGDAEALEQLIQTTVQASSVADINPQIKSDFLALANKRVEIQLARTPDDARYFLFAGSLSANFGDFEKGIKYLNRALELSPKKQTILFTLGTTYLSKGDLASATKVLKQAYDLDPTSSEARRMYALVLVYGKQISASDEILKTLSRESVLSDQRMIIAYYTSGYPSRALESINYLLKTQPSNPQLYFTRAAAELALGRTAEAIADLKKTIEINPSAKAQVEQIINDVRAGRPVRF